jgi:hypothetical protein
VTGTKCGWTVTYTFKVKDECNNYTTNQTYTRSGKDQTAPALTSTPYTGTTGTNACMADAASAAPFNAYNAKQGYSDNCGGMVTAELTGTSVTGTNCSWTVTYTFKVKDECGNELTNRSYSNTGSDQTAPVVTVPSNINVSYNPSSCGAVVNYTVSAFDNCSGAITPVLTAGLASGATFPLGTTTVTYKATDPCGNSSSKSFTVTVGSASTTSTLTVTPGTAQYSDQVTLKVVIAGGASLCSGPNAATSATFKIKNNTTLAEQVMKHPVSAITNIPFAVNGNDLEAILTTPLLDYVLNSGVMAPGIKTVCATINGIAPEFSVSQPANTSLTVTKENAWITYTGDMLKATASSGTSYVTLNLSANILDISVPQSPIDPLQDPNPGDIRNARVTFVNRDASDAVIGSANLTPALVNALDNKIGNVNVPFTITGLTSSSPSQQVRIGIIVDNGYYIRNNADDDVVVTGYLPVGDFITGGGYIIPYESVGSKASDDGKKANFGFNVKFGNGGKNLQGSMNIIFRRTESDGLVHNYQIKANSMQSLGVNATNPNRQTAEYVSKVTVKDVGNSTSTDPDLGGNRTLYVKMVDNGEPGVNDSISLVIVNGTANPAILSNIIWSSNWVGSMTQMMKLGGGNLQVHSGFNVGTTIDNNTITTRNAQMEVVPVITPFNVKVFPNPSTDQFSLYLEGGNNDKVHIVVYDAMGREVKKFEKEGGNIPVIFGRDLTGGAYFVEVRQGENHKTIKLIKQN